MFRSFDNVAGFVCVALRMFAAARCGTCTHRTPIGRIIPTHRVPPTLWTGKALSPAHLSDCAGTVLKAHGQPPLQATTPKKGRFQ